MSDQKTWYERYYEIGEEVMLCLPTRGQMFKVIGEINEPISDDDWFYLREQLWAIREGLAEKP